MVEPGLLKDLAGVGVFLVVVTGRCGVNPKAPRSPGILQRTAKCAGARREPFFPREGNRRDDVADVAHHREKGKGDVEELCFGAMSGDELGSARRPTKKSGGGTVGMKGDDEVDVACLHRRQTRA